MSQWLSTESGNEFSPMKHQIHRRCFPLAVTLAASMCECARADLTAVAFEERLNWNTAGGGTVVQGWQFTALSALRVSTVGYWDWFNGPDDLGYHPGDGLQIEHTIGIWEVSNPTTPLVTATVPAGTVAPLQSGFRYVSITPITLEAGREYVVGTEPTGPDNQVGEVNNPEFVLTVGPGIGFGGRRVGASPGLIFPGTYYPGSVGMFGANFSYTIIPEPTTLAFLGLGALVLVSARRRGN